MGDLAYDLESQYIGNYFFEDTNLRSMIPYMTTRNHESNNNFLSIY